MSVSSRVLDPRMSAAIVVAPPRARRVALIAVSTCLVMGGLLGAAQVHRFRTSSTAPVPIPAPPLLRALSDLRTIDVTFTTAQWTKRHELVTVDRLRTDRTLWRAMHFEDWDDVPTEIREPSLRAMVRTYSEVFAGPSVWQRMTAADWDSVPQPMRSIADLRMIWFWAAFENVGAEFGLDPHRIAQTIGAIVMAESWFQHRAVNENARGNRDLGLAQCSGHCRATLAEMAADGEIGFLVDEADYFNPWKATRIATVWFQRELRRARGDVDLATRAYHRGLVHALDERGDAYVARVRELRDRYIRVQGRSPSWQWLAREIGSL